MTGRDVSTRLLVVLFVAGCYDVPKPDCGFRCEADSGCPDGYTCASDGRCHRDGADPGLSCPTPDGGGGYSPRIVSSMPLPGEAIERTANLNVVFDVEVVGVDKLSFFVVDRATQTPFDGIVSYDPGAKRASLFARNTLPASQLFDMILTSAISDPQTGNVLMEARIAFATKPDTTPPEVTSVMPTSGSIQIPVAVDITVNFSEDVTGVNASTLRISDTTPPPSVVYMPAARSATMILHSQLAPHTTYTVSTASGIFDTSTNALVPFTSTFTTGDDVVRPQLYNVSPPQDGTDIPINSNVVVTFDEPVMNVTATSFQLDNGAIAGAITMSNGNRTATFDPTANLPAATTITVKLTGAITDTSGNPLPMTTFSFATQ
jgi:Bacterial Ig-like domain